MGHERWFRGQNDGQSRPFDWLAAAQEQGIPKDLAWALYARARQQAHGSTQMRVQEIYLALLADAGRERSCPSPGKVTRTMRLQGERTGKRRPWSNISPLTGQPIAPGKVTLTSYIQPGRRPAQGRHNETRVSEELMALASTEGRAFSVSPERRPDETMLLHEVTLATMRGDLDAIEPRELLAAEYGIDVGESRPAAEDEEDAAAQPLPEGTRVDMERAFGQRFDDVEVYVDSPEVMGDMHAFTRGREIHFRMGAFAPGTRRGDHIIAHELAHIVQQSGEQVSSGQARQGRSTGALEADADRAAMRALVGQPAAVQLRSSFGRVQAYRDAQPGVLDQPEEEQDESTAPLAEPEPAGTESAMLMASDNDECGATDGAANQEPAGVETEAKTEAASAEDGRAASARPKRAALAEKGQSAGPIQAKGQAATPEAPARLPGHGSGARMPEDVRRKMEAAFGADFSQVRIHEGPQAEAIGAQAYTQGTDIHFAPGQYQPGSRRGQELLGHELTHVLQQAAGRVRATVRVRGAPMNDDPALEREADVLGARAARGEKVASVRRPGQLARAPNGPGQAKIVDPVSNEPPAAGQDAPVGLDMTQAVQDPPAESLSLSERAPAPAEGNWLTAPVQAKERPAPIQAHALQQPIQRQEGDQQKKIYVPYRISITRPMTGEEFKATAARQVFGAVIEGVAWKNVKDSYSPENSPVTLHVEVGLLNRYRGQVNRARGFTMDPDGGISGAGNRARTFQSAPASDEKTALLAEIDRRYAAATGVPEGTVIEPEQAGQAALWRTIRDEVLFQHEYIANLPPKVKELIRVGTSGKTLAPADYDQLFRIAKKIEGMPPGHVADYLSKVNGATADLIQFESSLDEYTAEMAQRASQTEERQAIQTKLYGLEEVYKQYRQYRSMLMLEALNAGMGVGLGPRASTSMREALTQKLQAHGFASISEFEAYIQKFEKAFELGAATMVIDLLAKYEGALYREAERYKDPREISDLYQRLGGVRRHHAEFAISNDYARNAERSRLLGNGHLRPTVTQGQASEAHQQAEAAKQAAQAEFQVLSGGHPIFQEEGLPLDKRIDKTALAKAGEGQLGALISGHIASRINDIQQARSQLQGNSELIYKMEMMMPRFYAQQGIAPGSIYDAIIQDKLRDDAIIKLAGGILLALVAVALTVVSFGSATPALVAAGAAAGAFGLSGYMVYDEYKQYTEQQALADVGLVDHPSIIWLVLAVAGAAVDMGAAVKAVRALAPAAQALNTGGDVHTFTKAVQALQKAGEIDVKIAQAVEKAALARQGFAQASGDLVKALGGKLNSFPGPFTDPEVFRILVQMAKAKIQEGVSSFQIFAAELQKARELAKLGDLSPQELAKAKEAWEQALRLAKSAEEPLDIIGESGRVIGRYSNGSHLEIVSREKNALYGGNTIRLDPHATTTVTGGLSDVNTVATRGQRLPGVTQMGANPGGINILRSPKWAEIQAKHKAILESGDTLRYWRTVTDEFWEVANKPWLDEAIARGDNFRFVSNPADDIAIHVTDPKGRFVLDAAGNKMKSIFGREVDYLRSKGYTFLSDGTAVKAQ